MFVNGFTVNDYRNESLYNDSSMQFSPTNEAWETQELVVTVNIVSPIASNSPGAPEANRYCANQSIWQEYVMIDFYRRSS